MDAVGPVALTDDVLLGAEVRPIASRRRLLRSHSLKARTYLSVTVAFVVAASYNSSYKIAQYMGLFDEKRWKPEVQYLIELVGIMEREETSRSSH